VLGGHYGCGGVKAAMGQLEYGMIDNWLRGIKDVYTENKAQLSSKRVSPPSRRCVNFVKAIKDEQKKFDLLVEMSVSNSVYNVCHTRIVQQAWASGQELSVHGWCYKYVLISHHIRIVVLTVSTG
jgi:carbonic anhydrase